MIKSGLLHGESLIAVYDLKGGGTGFIGLTTKRLIIQDNSFAGGRHRREDLERLASLGCQRSWAGSRKPTVKSL
jgi:hypothetical protein